MASKTPNQTQIHLRKKLSRADLTDDTYQNGTITVVAPEWVEEALAELSPHFEGRTFFIYDEEGNTEETITVSTPMTLIDLQRVARNEKTNVTGEINFDLYADIDKDAIILLRDLAKFCTVVGRTKISHYGGYTGRANPESRVEFSKPIETDILDLSGIQFQRLMPPEGSAFAETQGSFNTGRYVLTNPVYATEESSGLRTVEDMIATHAIKTEPMAKYGVFFPRYMKFTFESGEFKGHTIDPIKYASVVREDFLLAMKSENANAEIHGDADNTIDFRFLAYGSGYFCEGLPNSTETIQTMISVGILAALEDMYTHQEEGNYPKIKKISLPHMKNERNAHIIDEIENLCDAMGFEFEASRKDALHYDEASETSLRVATTNCGDPHAGGGNEMDIQGMPGFDGCAPSVDAQIFTNMVSEGREFSPLINKAMQQQTLSSARELDEHFDSIENFDPFSAKELSARDIDTIFRQLDDNPRLSTYRCSDGRPLFINLIRSVSQIENHDDKLRMATRLNEFVEKHCDEELLKHQDTTDLGTVLHAAIWHTAKSSDASFGEATTAMVTLTNNLLQKAHDLEIYEDIKTIENVRGETFETNWLTAMIDAERKEQSHRMDALAKIAESDTLFKESITQHSQDIARRMISDLEKKVKPAGFISGIIGRVKKSKNTTSPSVYLKDIDSSLSDTASLRTNILKLSWLTYHSTQNKMPRTIPNNHNVSLGNNKFDYLSKVDPTFKVTTTLQQDISMGLKARRIERAKSLTPDPAEDFDAFLSDQIDKMEKLLEHLKENPPRDSYGEEYSYDAIITEEFIDKFRNVLDEKGTPKKIEACEEILNDWEMTSIGFLKYYSKELLDGIKLAKGQDQVPTRAPK